MHPGGVWGAVALTVHVAIGQAPVLLLLLPLLLQDVRDGVQKVVQELVCILLHVVIKQFCEIKHKAY